MQHRKGEGQLVVLAEEGDAIVDEHGELEVSGCARWPVRHRPQQAAVAASFWLAGDVTGEGWQGLGASRQNQETGGMDWNERGRQLLVAAARCTHVQNARSGRAQSTHARRSTKCQR